MQQRQLRLGDIIDDYCPRERRLANHTIVAMVGDDIRLTRCTTCDTEHTYKSGKVPRQRRKSPVQAAYDEVLDSVKKDADIPGTLAPQSETEQSPASLDAGAPDGSAAGNGAGPDGDAEPAPEEIRLHRPLIRASLPRVEAQPPPRPIPEFTIRQNTRPGRFQNNRSAGRFAKGRPGNNGFQGNSRGPGGQHGRPSGHGPARHGQGRPGQHQGGGKKRSR